MLASNNATHLLHQKKGTLPDALFAIQPRIPFLNHGKAYGFAPISVRCSTNPSPYRVLRLVSFASHFKASHHSALSLPILSVLFFSPASVSVRCRANPFHLNSVPFGSVPPRFGFMRILSVSSLLASCRDKSTPSLLESNLFYAAASPVLPLSVPCRPAITAKERDISRIGRRAPRPRCTSCHTPPSALLHAPSHKVESRPTSRCSPERI